MKATELRDMTTEQLTAKLGELKEEARIVARKEHVIYKIGLCNRNATHIEVEGEARHREIAVFEVYLRLALAESRGYGSDIPARLGCGKLKAIKT